jgi:hypothetical protein
MPAGRCGARTLSGSRSTPRCSPRTSASQPTPSCCTPAIRGLNRLAAKHGVPPRQSYVHIAKRAAMMAGRYAHAKQFNRHRRELRIPRTRLGRLIRDISRKIAGQESVEAALALPLARASQIHPSSSASAVGSSIHSMRPRPNASARATHIENTEHTKGMPRIKMGTVVCVQTRGAIRKAWITSMRSQRHKRANWAMRVGRA